ncbi:hypothetical protein LguiA_013364 [Lonicera macranthoides]
MSMWKSHFLVAHATLLLSLLILLLQKASCSNETDHLSLLAIKAQITSDTMQQWNQSLHFCQWKGVSCGKRHKTRVVGLNFESWNLVGTLSPSIGNLSFLKTLQLSNNIFRGEIPHEIGQLLRLRSMALTNNSFVGKIPAEISFCSRLRILDLNNNKFTEELPVELGSLSLLFQLAVESNELKGTIPPSFGNLSSLEDLRLTENMLEGSIPDSLGQLKHLKYLTLSLNQLSGTIPPSIFNLSSIINISLASNQLEGNLPRDLGFLLPNLGRLNIWGNKLAGSIPISLSNASNLASLDLSINGFSGGMPIDFGNAPKLYWLGMIENNLGSDGGGDLHFISSLANCSLLTILSLDRNNFGEALPNTIANLSTKLHRFSIGGNQLSGVIPTGIGNLVSLTTLNMHYNQLTGSIPTSIGSLNKLQEVGFGENRLSGEIPFSIGNLTLLNQLWRKHTALTFSPVENFLNISYGQLLKATNSFSSANLVGLGSFGSVYKGILDGPNDLKFVAVKVLNLNNRRASKSFIAECEALRNIRHRNLVKILTVCSSTDYNGNDFKALVYEYMENGSLDTWLYPNPQLDQEDVHEEPKTSLNLLQRLNVAIDVASALDYLHNHCPTPIVHCDLKPRNILLDGEMTARVSDFGLARFLKQPSDEISQNQSSSTGIKGTIGYAAPEYGMGSEVSKYGDVYSYGILLLEMFTGKRPTDAMFNDNLNLHKLAKEKALLEQVMEFADQIMLFREEGGDETNSSKFRTQTTREDIQKGLVSILKIGVACSKEAPRERMEIFDAAMELKSIKDMLYENWIPN